LDGRMFVLYVRRGVCPAARLGLAVGRRVGGAVARNRVKRLLREAFAEVARTLAQADLVVVPKAEILGHGLGEIDAELRSRLEVWRRDRARSGARQ
jgi:ribonuclease P protein component